MYFTLPKQIGRACELFYHNLYKDNFSISICNIVLRSNNMYPNNMKVGTPYHLDN